MPWVKVLLHSVSLHHIWNWKSWEENEQKEKWKKRTWVKRVACVNNTHQESFFPTLNTVFSFSHLSDAPLPPPFSAFLRDHSKNQFLTLTVSSRPFTSLRRPRVAEYLCVGRRDGEWRCSFSHRKIKRYFVGTCMFLPLSRLVDLNYTLIRTWMAADEALNMYIKENTASIIECLYVNWVQRVTWCSSSQAIQVEEKRGAKGITL